MAGEGGVESQWHVFDMLVTATEVFSREERLLRRITQGRLTPVPRAGFVSTTKEMLARFIREDFPVARQEGE